MNLVEARSMCLALPSVMPTSKRCTVCGRKLTEETAAEMRIRIESRDERMREDLRENFSGRIWFGVDVVGEDVE